MLFYDISWEIYYIIRFLKIKYILHNDFSNGDAEGADNDKNVGWTQYESLQDVVDGYNQGNGNPISIIGIKDE